jgi:hypothetical protein
MRKGNKAAVGNAMDMKQYNRAIEMLKCDIWDLPKDDEYLCDTLIECYSSAIAQMLDVRCREVHEHVAANEHTFALLKMALFLKDKAFLLSSDMWNLKSDCFIQILNAIERLHKQQGCLGLDLDDIRSTVELMIVRELNQNEIDKFNNKQVQP